MDKHICPRCDRVFPEWQPIHFSCLAGRLRYWLFGATGLLLILFLVTNYQSVLAAISRDSANEVELVSQASSSASEVVEYAPADTELADESQNAAYKEDSGSSPETESPSIPLSTGHPTRTPTLGPTRTPIPTPRPTRTPTPTRRPTRTPTPTPTPAQPQFVCSKSARGEFSGVWQHYGARLGCPIQQNPIPNSEIVLVEQPFSNGHMFYFESGSMKFVIVKYGTGTEGSWRWFDDQWDGRNDNHCFEAQEIEPRIVRGFNLIWCTYPEIRDPLGWPLDIERDLNLELAQGFENGFILRDSDGYTHDLVYVLFHDGTYERVRYR